MTKEVIIRKRVRFISMNDTSKTAGRSFKQIKRDIELSETETQPLKDDVNNAKIDNSTEESVSKIPKIVDKRESVNNETEIIKLDRISLNMTHNNYTTEKIIEKRDDEKIEINFKDFENTDGNHEAISPNFWQKFKKFSKARIPILCRLFSSYESAIENLMTTYLNVGGLSAHKAIQNYCLSKISDNQETNDKPKSKMSGILSWVNRKLQKMSGKSNSKIEEVDSGDQSLSFYPNKLNIIIVSPDSENIKQLQNVNDSDGVEDIEDIAMDDLQTELLEQMNEAKVLENPTEGGEEENSKKKRSCFGFKCLDEEVSPKNLISDNHLSDLNALSIAIKDYDKSNNHLNQGSGVPKQRNIYNIENLVPEIEKKRKVDKIESFLSDLRDKKQVEKMHRSLEVKKSKNIEKVDKSFYQNFTDFSSLNPTTIYVGVFSVLFVIIFLSLIFYICWRRKLKKLRSSNSSFNRSWYHKGEVVDDISDDDDSDRLIDQLNHGRSRPPSLKVKGDKKSRKQSYLDDFKPVGPFRKKEKIKPENKCLMESENESLNESDYEINTKYKTSGTVTK